MSKKPRIRIINHHVARVNDSIGSKLLQRQNINNALANIRRSAGNLPYRITMLEQIPELKQTSRSLLAETNNLVKLLLEEF